MAPVNLYDISVPPIKHALHSLRAILKKAEDHCNEQKIPHDDILQARLAPDMNPLTFQIQTCSNTAKFIPVRVAGAENVSMEDKEATFEQLQARIAQTLELLESTKRQDFEGKEETEISFREWKFTGLHYVTLYAMPNFYFHFATAYDILRMKGVSVGKRDFLGV